MNQDPQEPSQSAIDRMAGEGATQDSRDPNRFINQNGRVVGYAEGGIVKIENGQWENT